MRRLRALLMLASVLVVIAPVDASAASLPTRSRAAHCGAATRIHAFTVAAEWTRRTYRRSQSAQLTVTVTRPAPEDPAELGIPIAGLPVSVPAEGVTVWSTVLNQSFPPVFGAGVTDAQGKVTYKIALKNVKPGTYDVAHYASLYTNEGGCPDIEEWGFLYEAPGVTVLP